MKYKGFVIIGLLLAIVIIISCKTHFETAKSDYKAVVNAQNLEHAKIWCSAFAQVVTTIVVLKNS